MASHAKLSIYATENWSVWLLLEAEWASKACYRRKTWDTIYVMVLTSKTFYYRRIRVSRNKSVSEAALNAAIIGNLPSSLQGHAGADVTHCLLNQTRLPFDMFPSMKIRSSNGSPVAYSESGKLLLLEVATYASKRAESNGRTKDCRSVDTRHAGSGPSICLKFYPFVCRDFGQQRTHHDLLVIRISRARNFERKSTLVRTPIAPKPTPRYIAPRYPLSSSSSVSAPWLMCVSTVPATPTPILML